MHQLVIAGKLPTISLEYKSNLEEFISAHQNEDDIEIDRDGSTIRDLMQKYITDEDSASFVMIMWGWYYNMDVHEWVEKAFGFQQKRVHLAEGEDTAHGSINILHKVDSDGDIVFDSSLDFAFTSNGNIEDSTSRVIENEDEVADQDGNDEHVLHDLDNNDEGEPPPRFFQLSRREEEHYDINDLSDVTEQVTGAPEQCEVLDVAPSRLGLVAMDGENALEHLVVVTKVAQVTVGGFMPGKSQDDMRVLCFVCVCSFLTHHNVAILLLLSGDII